MKVRCRAISSLLPCFLFSLFFPQQLLSNELCLHWQQTNFQDSCARTGIKSEGLSFFFVNEQPVQVFTVSMPVSVSCPNPHFESDGLVCGGGSGGQEVQQQWFRGCFDGMHLLPGDNIFQFQVSTLSVSSGLFPTILGDANHCTHMIHSVLLQLPNGESILIFGVTHAGKAFSGSNIINLSLFKIDPAMAAELRQYMEELRNRLAQIEALERSISGADFLERQTRELEAIDGEIRRLQQDARQDILEIEKKLTWLHSQRANLAYRQNLADESELLKRIYSLLQEVHSGPIGSMTIPELLKLVLEQKDKFRERDLVNLGDFVREIAEKTKGSRDRVNGAIRTTQARLEEMMENLNRWVPAFDGKTRVNLQNAETAFEEKFQGASHSRSSERTCSGVASRAFRRIASQSLRELQKTVADDIVIDRRGFLSEYKKWISQQILATKDASSQEACREDVVALEQTNNQVREFVAKHYDEKKGWFLRANISPALQDAVQNKLASIDPVRARKLRQELNLWSYGPQLSPQQGLVSETLFLAINAFHEERKNSDGLRFEAIEQLNVFMDQAIQAVIETASLAADIGIGMTPFLGDFKDFCEAATGRHMCLPNGAELSTEERFYSGMGIIAGSGVFWKGVANVAKGTFKELAERISVRKYFTTKARWDKVSRKYGIPQEVTDALSKLRWDLPDEVFEKIPKDLVEVVNLNKKGDGIRWFDRKTRGANYNIRIDKGNRKLEHAHQRVDHVRITFKGEVVGRNGMILSSKEFPNPGNHPLAHIPLSEWILWKQGFKP